ncbi:MAG: glycosyltransferase [Planctomycetes bacterium]|nr:glycosyltransferase [Planctomycetota bacterium]
MGSPLRVAGAGRLAEGLLGAERLGWLDREALRGELRRARALLFPARWQEPFGLVGLEALAQGTPVIAMETGGVSDWAGEGARLVGPGDVGAMVAEMRALEADPALALALGERGRQAAARFDRETILARWEALLAEVAG